MKLNEKKSDRELERKVRSYSLEEQRENFLAAVRKWEILSATKVKNVNNNRYDISSVKRVTRKFLEVSRCGHAQQRQRNVQKMCAARAKLFFFLLMRPIFVFSLLSLPSPLSITRFYILFEQTINIIDRTWAIDPCLEFSRCPHNYIACVAGFSFLLAKTSFFQVCGWNV